MRLKTISEFLFSFCLCYTLLGITPAPKQKVSYNVAVLNVTDTISMTHKSVTSDEIFKFSRNE